MSQKANVPDSRDRPCRFLFFLQKKEEEEKLPFCTTAASAEHARANEENEPCDDYRAGE